MHKQHTRKLTKYPFSGVCKSFVLFAVLIVNLLPPVSCLWLTGAIWSLLYPGSMLCDEGVLPMSFSRALLSGTGFRIGVDMMDYIVLALLLIADYQIAKCMYVADSKMMSTSFLPNCSGHLIDDKGETR